MDKKEPRPACCCSEGRVSCASSAEEAVSDCGGTAVNEKAKWTFMVYLDGDNNLSTAGDKDLSEMRAVGSTSDVNVVVEFDNAGNRGTNRYHVQRDGLDEHVVSMGETDSGSPEVLLDFIAWVAEEYPADRYALILWNHGGGWEPSEIDRIAREVGSRDYNAREASERSATPLGKLFFRTSIKTIFDLPSPEDRSICSDDGSGHSLLGTSASSASTHSRAPCRAVSLSALEPDSMAASRARDAFRSASVLPDTSSSQTMVSPASRPACLSVSTLSARAVR